MMDPTQLDIPDHFETKRMAFRAYGPGDGQAYFEIIARNRDHLRGIMPEPILCMTNAQDAEAFVRQWASDGAALQRFCFGGWEKASHEFVAEIYIQAMDWDVPTIELGFYADVLQQGKGYVSEAVQAAIPFIFDHMKAHKICVVCDDADPKSHAVAERCGFMREGVLREQKRRLDGGFISSRFYGLLRSEYENNTK